MRVVLGNHVISSIFSTFSTWAFPGTISIRIDILWAQFLFHRWFWNYAYFFYMVWRCASYIFFSTFKLTWAEGGVTSTRYQHVGPRYLVGATPPRIFHRSFLIYAYLFYMVGRCACEFGVIPPLPPPRFPPPHPPPLFFFINTFLFFDLAFIRSGKY